MSQTQTSKSHVWFFVLAIVSFFFALSFIRFEVVSNASIASFYAIQKGLYVGWIFDVLALCFVLGMSLLMRSLLSLPLSLGWGFFSIFIWAGAVSNEVFFRHFGSQIYWWVVKFHLLVDIHYVTAAPSQIAVPSWRISLSVGLLLFSFVFIFLFSRSSSKSETTWKKIHQRGAGFKLGAILLTLALTGMVGVSKAAPVKSEMMINQLLLRTWLAKAYSSVQLFSKAPVVKFHNIPGYWLNQYRHYRDNPAFIKQVFDHNNKNKQTKGAKWPLVQSFKVDALETRKLRTQLGLSPDKKPNVVILFVESLRMFEFQHPKIAPDVFPRLKKRFAKQAILFTQTYTSGLTPGATARGQFTTHCSMLPNLIGVAPYLGFRNLHIRCMQDYLKKDHYQTISFFPAPFGYHGTGHFEKNHGTQHFYDDSFFRKRGVKEDFMVWGLPDGPLLMHSLQTIQKHAQEKKTPFYASILTLTSHYPFPKIPGIKLSAKLEKATQSHTKYNMYLKTLKYVDKTLDIFLEKLFSSPAGENTVVVLLGDHGTPFLPHLPLNPLQTFELQFRVPLAILSKNMTKGTKIHRPVHQLDIAPTLARVIGTAGSNAWLGKGLFRKTGSPWLYKWGDFFSYRTASRGCYTLHRYDSMNCFDLRTKDPFDNTLPPSVPENHKQSLFFRKVAEDDSVVFQQNRIIPPPTR